MCTGGKKGYMVGRGVKVNYGKRKKELGVSGKVGGGDREFCAKQPDLMGE